MKYVAGCLLLLSACPSYAAIIINSTRVIYRQADGEAVVQLRNASDGPLLVQAWLDEGDARAKVDTLVVPFALMPSVARIDASRSQAIRIIQTRDSLPPDRESLLWLNVLEMPPVPTRKLQEGDNLIQFSFRSRIKFFYRPSSIGMSPEGALRQLHFSLAPRSDGPTSLVVHNPSPYHITIRNLSLQQENTAATVATMGRATHTMVAPGGELSLPLQWNDTHAAGKGNLQVTFTVINDQGGESRQHKGMIRHAAAE